jgi:hypothetical protein
MNFCCNLKKKLLCLKYKKPTTVFLDDHTCVLKLLLWQLLFYNARQLKSSSSSHYDWQCACYYWKLYKIQNKTGMFKVYDNHQIMMDMRHLTIEHYTRYRARQECVKYIIIITIRWTWGNSLLNIIQDTKQERNV